MAHTIRFSYSAVLLVLSLLAASEARAGWWHRHCGTCSSSTGYHSAAAPASAPSAAPMYYYAIPAQAAPAQGLLTSLQDVASVIKLIQDLRGSLGNTNSNPIVTTPGVSQTDSPDIAASLSRIEAGQNDLRGRLINNAGILQSIGERLGDKGPIMLKLDSLTSSAVPPSHASDAGKPDSATDNTKPTEGAKEPSPSAEFVTTTDFNQFKIDLSGQLKMLQDTVNKLDPNKVPSTDPKTKGQSLTPKQGGSQ